MRLIASLLTTTILVGALAACAPPEPPITRAWAPASKPVFASEEDALAAAEQAYALYQAAVDNALATFDESALELVAQQEALAAAQESVVEFETQGRRQVGNTLVETVELVQADLQMASLIQTYACLDVSMTDVVDSSGVSVISLSRAERVPVIVSFSWSAEIRHLLVTNEEVWEGDFCA